MPGRTGKLTRDALVARGPRMVLTQGRVDNGQGLLVIFREDLSPFKAGFLTGCFMTTLDSGEYISFQTLAKSFTLHYLLKIGKTMQQFS